MGHSRHCSTLSVGLLSRVVSVKYLAVMVKVVR